MIADNTNPSAIAKSCAEKFNIHIPVPVPYTYISIFSLEYVKCMIADNTNPSAIAKSCAEKLAIRFNDIQEWFHRHHAANLATTTVECERITQLTLKCCRSGSESERIRKFWPDSDAATAIQ
jgi:hypothetical protein